MIIQELYHDLISRNKIIQVLQLIGLLDIFY